VSIFLVDEVTVNGPNDELDSVSDGKSLSCIVTVALPLNILKSGKKRLILIKSSPCPPSASKVKLPDSIKALILCTKFPF